MSVKIGVSGASLMARDGRESFMRYVELCEQIGWDSLWFSDRIVGSPWRLDPIAGMALVAARTDRLKFGSSVLIMSVRSPVTTARSLASIDMMSNGRLVVGVGVGQESPVEYEAMGVRKAERGRRLDEAIGLMRRLWTEEKVTYRSEFVNLTDTGLGGIRPFGSQIPIWIGSRSEAGLRRTGRLGDGWLPTQVTTDELAYGVNRIKQYASEAGREIPEDHFGLQISCYVSEDDLVPDRIKDQYLLQRRTDVDASGLNLLGSPERIISRLQDYIKAGATKFVLNPACGAAELESQLRMQAELIVQPFHSKLISV